MKKILIVGNNSSADALAKIMAADSEVYITSNRVNGAYFVDIREDNVKELLNFAMENGVDLTIAASENAIKADISQIFTANKMSVFAPDSNSSEIVYNKIAAKKMLYKLRIPTPKFGIFDKENMALDYIKNQKMPCVIKTNDNNSAVVVTNMNVAKKIINSIFAEKNQRVIIEDYFYGSPFAFYAITDGYKALPIGSSLNYKHSLEGNGGQLTNGMGSIVPNYKLSVEHEYYLMDDVIYPVLNYLETGGRAYTGILGINGIINEDGVISVLGFQSFTQNSDTMAIFKHVDENLYELLISCVVATFSDEFETIKIDNRASATVVLNCKNKKNAENIISGLDNLSEDTEVIFNNNVYKNRYLEYQINNSGSVMSLTTSAATVGTAVKRIYEEIKEISFDGMSYRSDIR